MSSPLTADAADVIGAIRSMQLLDDSTLHVLKQLFCNRTDEDLVEALVAVRPAQVATVLFQVVLKASSTHMQAYALCFFADLVFLSPTLAKELGRLRAADIQAGSDSTAAASSSMLRGANGGDESGVAPLLLELAATHAGNISVTNPAIYLAAVAMRYGGSAESLEPSLMSFFAMVNRSFSEEVLQVSNVEFVVRACGQLARRKDLRSFFLRENILSYIPRLLTDMVSANTSSILQLIYDTLLLTWLLSFEYEGTVQLQQSRMIPQLLRVLQRLQKEKCLRLALMVLWNMVEAERRYLHYVLHPASGEWVDEKVYLLAQLREGEAGGRKGPVLIAEMVGVGMQKTLAALKRRKYGDEDITVMLEELSTRLEESLETITTFSEYRGEVFSGALDWTPVHTSSKFWREHSLQMEANNYEVLNALGQIILETRDDRTLAVACHDLGETVRYHPTGRSLLSLPSMRGVKEKVIHLMSDSRPEVSKEALLCTQKIMVQQWEYIKP